MNDDSLVQDVKVIVVGKRIWWKPWKREIKEYYIKDVNVSTEDFLNFTFTKADQ
jgi:GH18 family chitinase